MARAKGIDKSTGYLVRVFCVEYDLGAMCRAYGREFMHWLVDEICDGRINCKQSVERWSADKHLYSFEQVRADYESEADYGPDVMNTAQAKPDRRHTTKKVA